MSAKQNILAKLRKSLTGTTPVPTTSMSIW